MSLSTIKHTHNHNEPISLLTHMPSSTVTLRIELFSGPHFHLQPTMGFGEMAGNSLRILSDDLPLPQQSSTSGIYKELGDLRHKNRMAFIKSKDRGTAIDTLVREGHHSLYDVDFSLANLISDDFSIMGRLISEVVK